MELLILSLCILFLTRNHRPSRLSDKCKKKISADLKEIDEYNARVQLRLRNAEQYLEECKRTGDPEYLEYAKEERIKAQKLVDEFKIKHRL